MIRWRPLVRRVLDCVWSDDLRTQVLEPGLADLAHERRTRVMGRWGLLTGYLRVALAVAMALPRDLLTHHGPSAGTIIRTVVAVAFPGLTPSVGITSLSPSHPRSRRAAPCSESGGRERLRGERSDF
jgi:hypothetical protein